MIEVMGLDLSARMFFIMMVSFSFFVGVFLMASPDAFKAIDKALQKEYGIKTRFVPHIENSYFDALDKFILKNRVKAGFFIAAFAFILLLVNKM